MFNEKQLRTLAAPLDARKVLTKPHSHGAQYLEGWYVAEQANKIFGCGEGSRELIRLECVSTSERSNAEGELTGKWDVTYIATMRVTVGVDLSRVSHTGTGASSALNGPLGEGHENAAKGAETDALKRALAFGFGNQFGLALYGNGQTEERLVDPTVMHSEVKALEAKMPQISGAVIEDLADLIERVVYLRKCHIESAFQDLPQEPEQLTAPH